MGGKLPLVKFPPRKFLPNKYPLCLKVRVGGNLPDGGGGAIFPVPINACLINRRVNSNCNTVITAVITATLFKEFVFTGPRPQFVFHGQSVFTGPG